MSDFNNAGDKNKTASCFGIGCLVVIAIGVMIAAVSSGGFGSFAVIGIVGLLIFFAVRNSRKKKQNDPNLTTSTVTAPSPNGKPPVPNRPGSR